MYSGLHVNYISIKGFKKTIAIRYFALEPGSRQSSARKLLLGFSHGGGGGGGGAKNTQVAESETLGAPQATLSLVLPHGGLRVVELLTS